MAAKHEYNGEYLTFNEIGKMEGIQPNHLRHKVNTKRYNIYDAVRTTQEFRATNGGKRYKWRGKMMTMKQVSKDVGIPYETLRRKRIDLKMSFTEIVNEQRKKRVRYEYFGEKLSLSDISHFEGININRAKERVVDGKYKPIGRNIPGLFEGLDHATIEVLKNGSNKELLAL